MKHFSRTFAVAIAVAIASVPAILADPSFAHYVATHPWAAAYLPIAAGIVKAVSKAYRENKGKDGTGTGSAK